MEEKANPFRNLPKVDAMLERSDVQSLLSSYPRWVVIEGLRRILEEKRKAIKEGLISSISSDEIAKELIDRIDEFSSPSLRRVINATGVVLHTNLGRAPLAKEAVEALCEIAPNYSNLELDLKTGKRGLRYTHVVQIIKRITSCESALVVNNNASAVFLILNTLAKGREVIVSRGELIEIGGAFRLPDVMESAGAILKEVGTTNRTRVSDYENAINENTALILKAHTSNYKIMGFVESPSLKELTELGKKHGIPVYADLGSGLFVDVRKFGLPHEPTVFEVLKSGVDLVSFSGDKLLGATQAGIILGKRELIEKLRKNPINRVLRIDKLTLSALEATLRLYMEEPEEKIPVLQMLKTPLAKLQERATELKDAIGTIPQLRIDIKKAKSAVGGGALPLAELDTVCVCLSSEKLSAKEIEERLRTKPKIPVISRIKDDTVLLDLRTIRDDEIEIAAKSVREAFS